MSQLTVYGVAQSRAARTLWMCRELGLEFDHQPIHFTDPKLHSDDYRDINPNSRIPSIRDGDFSLWESMAINLYLAKKHGGELCPRSLQEEALALQWSFWVMTEVEKPLLNVLLQRATFPAGSAEEKYFRERVPKDPGVEAANIQALERPLSALDSELGGRSWLVDDRFTVADLNVASVLAWARRAQLDLGPWPHLSGWLDRCLARPAAAAAKRPQ